MSTDMKRFTISVTPNMEAALTKLKQTEYCDCTRSEMLRDLILRGLASMSAEEAKNL